MQATLRDVVAEEVLVPAREHLQTGWRVDLLHLQGTGQDAPCEYSTVEHTGLLRVNPSSGHIIGTGTPAERDAGRHLALRRSCMHLHAAGGAALVLETGYSAVVWSLAESWLP